MAQATSTVTPVVGMGCSFGAGSDSYPGTIVEVSKSGKSIQVTRDEVINGVWNEGEYSPELYTCLTDWEGARTTYTLRSNGRWIVKGQPMKAWYCALTLDRRIYKQDPHF